jgi:hypothetical protein
LKPARATVEGERGGRVREAEEKDEEVGERAEAEAEEEEEVR